MFPVNAYQHRENPERRALLEVCTECVGCLERCPFRVDIIGKMKRAVEVFEGGGG